MNTSKSEKALIQLGEKLKLHLEGHSKDADFSNQLNEKIQLARIQNGWFTEKNVLQALWGLTHLLNEKSLTKWLADYGAEGRQERAKNVGIIMAGNIPLVGFHDLLCVLCTGHRALVKLSSDDRILLPFLVETLGDLDADLQNQVQFVERLENHEVAIATGSNNSARYFEYYFKNMPHIIRRNRTSIAVLDGSESHEELVGLGHDIFSYFGLGCRNVSKIFVPENFDLDRIFAALVDFEYVIENNKYANNYGYYKTIYMMNSAALLENGFFVMKEDASLHSPVSMLFYERYQSLDEVKSWVFKESENLQCVVTNNGAFDNKVEFGKTQFPEPWDYADGVDTMAFLTNLN